MLTQQVRIIPLAKALLRLAQWCLPFTASHILIFHIPGKRFTHHYLMLRRFLSSSTFSPPPKLPPAGTLPDSTSACPQSQGVLTCRFVHHETIYPPVHSPLCNWPSRPCYPPPPSAAFHNMDSICSLKQDVQQCRCWHYVFNLASVGVWHVSLFIIGLILC